MLQSSQSLRDVFVQALLAEAAYADLRSIAFSDFSGFEDALIDRGMTQAAAAYVAKYYGVLHHEPNTESGYSGTLFARRATIESPTPTGDITFPIRGTERASWSDAGFGTTAQTVQSLGSLQDGSARLT